MIGKISALGSVASICFTAYQGVQSITQRHVPGQHHLGLAMASLALGAVCGATALYRAVKSKEFDVIVCTP